MTVARGEVILVFGEGVIPAGTLIRGGVAEGVDDIMSGLDARLVRVESVGVDEKGCLSASLGIYT
jgi:hypothetical protein